MNRHVNIPIFIPHLGCPNQCVFCNQRTISGTESFSPDGVVEQIEDALKTVDAHDECEIAFFGGSFTGIDRELMIKLLSYAKCFIEDGRVQSIRLSTRPDYIDEEILRILKEYGVRTIELGLQSINEDVLRLTKRGHNFFDEKNACKLIVDYGFDLVGQMMIGLPGSSLQSEIDTARFIINSGAVAARIYPTVVFNDTELCLMCQKGEYSHLNLEDAVTRSAEVLKLFIDAGVKVLRIGLCASENLSDADKYYAGPNHPALGEMVYSRVYLKLIKEEIYKSAFSHQFEKILEINVPIGAKSKVIGQKKCNKIALKDEFGFKDVLLFEDESLTDYQIKINLKGT